jgi:hypothetical protein
MLAYYFVSIDYKWLILFKNIDIIKWNKIKLLLAKQDQIS